MVAASSFVVSALTAALLVADGAEIVPDDEVKASADTRSVVALVVVVAKDARVDGAEALVRQAERAGVPVVRVEVDAAAVTRLAQEKLTDDARADLFRAHRELEDRLRAVSAGRMALAIFASDEVQRAIRVATEAAAQSRGFEITSASAALSLAASRVKGPAQPQS